MSCARQTVGNPDLALSVYKAMSVVGRSGGGSAADASPAGSAASGWPPATLLTVRALVLGLARTLRVSDAIRQAQANAHARRYPGIRE